MSETRQRAPRRPPARPAASTDTSTPPPPGAAAADRRAARREVEQRRRSRHRLQRAVALGLALAVAVAALLWSQRDRGVVGVRVPDEGRGHVADGAAIPYKHDPPSSGPHYGTPAQAGFSTTAIAEGTFVHSLEHGYIVILYRCPADCAALRQQLQPLVQTFPPSKYGNVKLVIAPYEKMGSPITALAWDWELALDRVDEGQLRRFYQAHVDRAPEDVP